jgi:four helix bundle protein
MPFEALEEKRVYKRAEELADQVWGLVTVWEWFAKRGMGLQLSRAADSIGANIAEAGGRFHPSDVRNFLYYARGSLRETKYWIRRAFKRGLLAADQFASLDDQLEQLARELNCAINYQKTRMSRPQSPNNSTT